MKTVMLFLWVLQLLILAPLNALVIAGGDSSHIIWLSMNIIFGAVAWFMWRELEQV